MLIQLLANHPQAIGPIVRNTPIWVWALLAGLLALGLSQLRDRNASLVRVTSMPIGMTVFSAWGTLSAFGASPLLPQVMTAWIGAAAVVAALLGLLPSPARYDAARRSYALPGSVVPLLLIAGIFLLKYGVGVELAMAPQLATDGQYALVVAGLYGAFSGVFLGRATGLWRLALRAPLAAA
jgi:hypothetical protein